jgi:hypothetical protein
VVCRASRYGRGRSQGPVPVVRGTRFPRLLGPPSHYGTYTFSATAFDQGTDTFSAARPGLPAFRSREGCRSSAEKVSVPLPLRDSLAATRPQIPGTRCPFPATFGHALRHAIGARELLGRRSAARRERLQPHPIQRARRRGGSVKPIRSSGGTSKTRGSHPEPYQPKSNRASGSKSAPPQAVTSMPRDSKWAVTVRARLSNRPPR